MHMLQFKKRNMTFKFTSVFHSLRQRVQWSSCSWLFQVWLWVVSSFFSSISSLLMMRLQQWPASNSTCPWPLLPWCLVDQRPYLPWRCLTRFLVAFLDFCFPWYDSALLLPVTFLLPFLWRAWTKLVFFVEVYLPQYVLAAAAFILLHS